MEVYYEVWCPDSRRYIIDQALPAWEKFEAIVDLHWKPYGKASVGSINYHYFFQNTYHKLGLKILFYFLSSSMSKVKLKTLGIRLNVNMGQKNAWGT